MSQGNECPEGKPSVERFEIPPILDPNALARIRELQAPGDADLLTEIVNAFFADAPAIVAHMIDAHARGDGDGLADAAHSLKSGAAYLGAHELQRLCQLLETRGRTGVITDNDALISSLQTALEQTRLALRAELARQDATA